MNKKPHTDLQQSTNTDVQASKAGARLKIRTRVRGGGFASNDGD